MRCLSDVLAVVDADDARGPNTGTGTSFGQGSAQMIAM